MNVSQKDSTILRTLAGRIREIAALPVMAERKRLWHKHNALKGERPLVLAFPEGAWPELLSESVCECEDELLRAWEYALRQRIYAHEVINDDNVVEPFLDIEFEVYRGDLGFPVTQTHGDNRGSFAWEPPIKDLDRDIPRLVPCDFSFDKVAWQRKFEIAQELVGDIIPPRPWAKFMLFTSAPARAVNLLGFEYYSLAMYDAPAELHELMRFLAEEDNRYLDFLVRENLLWLNNGNDYVGSGGVAYTDELPQKDYRPGMPVRLCDVWGSAQAQDTLGISPEMFAEFILPYQQPAMERFGLSTYGCCEPLDKRLDALFAVRNLRRIAVSPWADQEVCAEKMGDRYVFSRKPNPTMVCVQFNEEEIRNDLRKTLAIASKLNLEIILKDTHTIQNEAWRIPRWVAIVREEIEKSV
jgi:hypothetical protein